MKTVSTQDLLKKYRDKKTIVGITAYDAGMASLVEKLNFDFILVGDSLGMVVLGYKNTIPVTMKDILHHGSAVVRGAPRSLVIVDMPFLSYQESEAVALRNAGKIIQKTGSQAVKMEGGIEIIPMVEKIIHAGIPVMGHVGVRPQSIHSLGSYRRQGSTDQQKSRIKADCLALQKSGCFAIVLECICEDLSQQITSELSIPTIGIGSGSFCSGQIRVIHDVLGLTEGAVPPFVKKYGDLRQSIQDSLKKYQSDMLDGRDSFCQ